jgi:hypothetical protein
VVKRRSSTVGDIEDVHVRDEDGRRKRRRSGAARGASSRMGIGARQPHRDSDVRGRKRREDAGWESFYGTSPKPDAASARFGGTTQEAKR